MLDISKAFDCVSHETLLDKLEFLGLPREWFANYLSNRTQYVSIGNGKSAPCEIKFGVPQGSCLGPVLFLCYLNFMPNCTSLESLMFADDCTIIGTGKNIDELCHKINNELKVIEDYFLSNNMLLHPTKTRFILFSRSPYCPDLWLGGEKIKRVQEKLQISH